MRTTRHWVLPREPSAPASARCHVSAACAGLRPDLLEVAMLLTSELVTNAVKYGGPRIDLTVRDEAGLLRVDVHDDGPLVPHLRTATRTCVGGRGLFLVQSLADAWGTTRTGQ